MKPEKFFALFNKNFVTFEAALKKRDEKSNRNELSSIGYQTFRCV
jgi:hypothetical protein